MRTILAFVALGVIVVGIIIAGKVNLAEQQKRAAEAEEYRQRLDADIQERVERDRQEAERLRLEREETGRRLLVEEEERQAEAIRKQASEEADRKRIAEMPPFRATWKDVPQSKSPASAPKSVWRPGSLPPARAGELTVETLQRDFAPMIRRLRPMTEEENRAAEAYREQVAIRAYGVPGKIGCYPKVPPMLKDFINQQTPVCAEEAK